VELCGFLSEKTKNQDVKKVFEPNLLKKFLEFLSENNLFIFFKFSVVFHV